MGSSPTQNRWSVEPVVCSNLRGLSAVGVVPVPGVNSGQVVAGVQPTAWCNCADLSFAADDEAWADVPYEILLYVGSVPAVVQTGLIGDLRDDRVADRGIHGLLPAVRGRAFTRLDWVVYPGTAPLADARFQVTAWGTPSPGDPTDQDGPAPLDLYARPSQRWRFSATGTEIGDVGAFTVRPADPRGRRHYVTHVDVHPASGASGGLLLEGEDGSGPERHWTISLALGELQTIDLVSPDPYRPNDLVQVTLTGGARAILDVETINVYGFTD